MFVLFADSMKQLFASAAAQEDELMTDFQTIDR